MKIRAAELQILYRLVCDKLIEEKYSEKQRKTAPRGEGLWSNLESKEYELRFGGYKAKTDQTYLYRKSLELDGINNSLGTIDDLTLFKLFKVIGFTSAKPFRDKKFSSAKTKILLNEFQEKFRQEIDALEFEFQLASTKQIRDTDYERAKNAILKYFNALLKRQWLSAFKLRDSYHPIAKGDFKVFKAWMRQVAIEPNSIWLINQNMHYESGTRKEVTCHVHVKYLIYPYLSDKLDSLSQTPFSEVIDNSLLADIKSELTSLGISQPNFSIGDLLNPIELHKNVFLQGYPRKPFILRPRSYSIDQVFDLPKSFTHSAVYKIICEFKRTGTRLLIKPESGRFTF